MSVPELAAVRVIGQRHGLDCLICCLAMLLGTSYEAALLAVSKIKADVGTKSGLTWADAIRAADTLGFSLQRRNKYNPDDVVGIVDLVPTRKEQPNRHAAILIRGTVIDPFEPTVWPEWEAYEIANNYKLGSALVQVKRAD